MIRAIDELTITDAVIEQMASTKSERLKELMNAAVRHLHAFAREVNLTPDEWIEGVKLVTATGHACTEYRQDSLPPPYTLNSCTSPTIQKHEVESARPLLPTFEFGRSIAENCPGEEIGVYGRLIDASGSPIPHAPIEVWQPDEDGFYDLQKQDPNEMELRGRFSDESGRYHFRTIKPTGYKIPMDGPVGIWSGRRDGMAGAPPTSTFSSVRRVTAK